MAGRSTGTRTSTGGAVEELITALGGVRPFAAAIGLSPSTVQGWKERGKIPKNRQAYVYEKLLEHGLGETLLVSALPNAHPADPASPPPAQSEQTSTARTTYAPARGVGKTGAKPTEKLGAKLGAKTGARPVERGGGDWEKYRVRRRIVTSVAVLVLLSAILLTILDIFLALPLGYEIPSRGERGVAQVIATDPERATRPALAPLAVQPTAAERARFAEAVQLEAVESRLKLLEEHVASLTAATRTLKRVEESLLLRLEEIEALARRRPDAAAATVLALAQLRATVDSGAPYREALDVATRLAPEQAATLTRALSEDALVGIASYNELARLLDQTLLAVRDSAAGQKGWFGRLIGVRLSKGADATDPVAALEQAQSALATGDLAAAVVAVESIGGASVVGAVAIHTEPWLRKARARLTATTALAEAQTSSLRILVQSVGAHDGGSPENTQ